MEEQPQTAPITELSQPTEGPAKPEKKSGGKKGIIIGIISTLLIVGLAGASYWYYDNYMKDSAAEEEESEPEEDETEQEEEEFEPDEEEFEAEEEIEAAAPVATTQECKSEILGVMMEVPNTWTCTESDINTVSGYTTGHLQSASTLFDIDIIVGGIGGVGMDCTTSLFYTSSPGVDYQKYDCPGNDFISGNLGHPSGGGLFLEYTDMETQSLTVPEMDQISAVLDSIILF